MAGKKNYSVEAASARDIDELVRKHADTTGVKGTHEEEVSGQHVNFVFFAAVATALPIFVFTTPIFQMSPLDNTAQCALTVVASVVLLFMSYVEVASKVLKGLKGKKKQSAQCLSVFTSHAAFSAIFHANMVYVFLALLNALYLLPLYGSSESTIFSLSVAGSAGLVFLLSKLF